MHQGFEQVTKQLKDTPAIGQQIFCEGFWFQIPPLSLTRVWTGGQWVQWETRPLHVQGNPLHLRKFPLHFQTCLKVGFKTSPAILLSKNFYGNFSKKVQVF